MYVEENKYFSPTTFPDSTGPQSAPDAISIEPVQLIKIRQLIGIWMLLNFAPLSTQQRWRVPYDPAGYVAKISGKMRHGTALEKRVQRHKRGERMTMMLSSQVLRWLWLSHTLHFGHHTHCKKQKVTNLGQIALTWPYSTAAWIRSKKVLYWWKLLKGRGACQLSYHIHFVCFFPLPTPWAAQTSVFVFPMFPHHPWVVCCPPTIPALLSCPRPLTTPPPLGLSEIGAEGQKVQKSKLFTFFLL